MNKKTRLLAVGICALAISLGVFTALGDQENNYESPCEHSYSVSSFSGNTVYTVCEHCGTETALDFADYVGAEENDGRYTAELDVNSDGIINGRDLAHLKNPEA